MPPGRRFPVETPAHVTPNMNGLFSHMGLTRASGAPFTGSSTSKTIASQPAFVHTSFRAVLTRTRRASSLNGEYLRWTWRKYCQKWQPLPVRRVRQEQSERGDRGPLGENCRFRDFRFGPPAGPHRGNAIGEVDREPRVAALHLNPYPTDNTGVASETPACSWCCRFQPAASLLNFASETSSQRCAVVRIRAVIVPLVCAAA